MWDWDGHLDSGWGLAMVLGMLGFWVLLTVAIGFAVVALVRATGTHQTAAEPAGSDARGGVTADPKHILAERLARGDIEPEEYRARLAALATPGEA